MALHQPEVVSLPISYRYIGERNLFSGAISKGGRRKVTHITMSSLLVEKIHPNFGDMSMGIRKH